MLRLCCMVQRLAARNQSTAGECLHTAPYWHHAARVWRHSLALPSASHTYKIVCMVQIICLVLVMAGCKCAPFPVLDELLYLDTFINFLAQIHLLKIGQMIWKQYLDSVLWPPPAVTSPPSTAAGSRFVGSSMSIALLRFVRLLLYYCWDCFLNLTVSTSIIKDV